MGVGNSARRGDSHITSAWPLGTMASSWPPKTLMAALASAVSTSQASSPWYCPLRTPWICCTLDRLRMAGDCTAL
ncbi:hypothetical protein G6F58_013581 [Rhizopus delemar]|nr:hypothetical protein G6F58_013581 [Rhizopus delemar]